MITNNIDGAGDKDSIVLSQIPSSLESSSLNNMAFNIWSKAPRRWSVQFGQRMEDRPMLSMLVC